MLRTARLLPLLRALDTGLRRRALPPDAASLLPGSLAITWTGLPPAGGDELADPTRSDHRTHRPPIQSRVSSGHAVGRPSPHDRNDRGEDSFGVRATQDAHLGGQPATDPLDGSLAGFDQQFPAVAANVEPQEVESVIQRHDSRLVLVEGETPGRQPLSQPCLDLLCLFVTVA